MNNKVYILIAGVNGAGKSTFYHSDYNIGDFFDFCDSSVLQGMHRVNADEILREFGNWRDPKAALEAGRIAVRKIRNFFNEGESFCQETTLCGRSIARNIDMAKTYGYKVGIIYVGIDSPDLAIDRVQQRVRKGGHGVDADDIRRRFDESLANLNEAINKCDGVLFFDNTFRFRSVAFFNGKEIQLTNNIEPPPKWFAEHINLQTIAPSMSSPQVRKFPNNPEYEGR